MPGEGAGGGGTGGRGGAERETAGADAVLSVEVGGLVQPNLADSFISDQRGIFLSRDHPIPLTFQPNTPKMGSSHPIPSHPCNQTLPKWSVHENSFLHVDLLISPMRK